jgi:hypothetical protein
MNHVQDDKGGGRSMDELTVPIHHKIYTLRGKQIMLDEDFMLQLSEKEYENLMSQIATSSFNVMGFIKDA